EPTGAPRKGTLVIVQGRTEFIEKYFDVIDELRARGFGVLAFDWRGQGGSGRLTSDIRKGHVRRFSDYQIDFEAIMD
uniref:alpha/beta hydrolase n=1 Tax=Citrobacter koseri TaxID=545 RepID=UPI0013D38986